MHTSSNEMMYPLTDNYPLAIANIVNKPVLCYQLEHLIRFGFVDIHICVEKRFTHKVERYLKNHFKIPTVHEGKINIDILSFNEDLYTVQVLRELQSRITSDLLVMEGDTIIDIPLDEMLDTHLTTGASLTCLIKEFDMTKGGKGAKMADVESDDIFGISTWMEDQSR